MCVLTFFNRPDDALGALHGFIVGHVSTAVGAGGGGGGAGEEADQFLAGRLRDYLSYHLEEEAGRPELAERLCAAVPEWVRVGQAVGLFVAVARRAMESN